MFRVLMLLLAALLVPGLAHAADFKLAVLEFAAAPGTPSDKAPLGKGFQEMILVDLSKAGAIDVVERRAVREQRLALGLNPLPGSIDQRRSLGQRSGATHVLSGGFAMEGQALTLSAELLDVASGKVLLTREVAGEAEAFFDLEKEVVQASIGALDLSLSARERAETRRLHTADYLAFQDFSRGLDDFDAERYESSLSSLRRAAERDTQFSLAAITLEQYRELITSIRAKADAIEVVKGEQERLAKLAAAGGEVEVVRRLLEIARKEGAAHQRARLTALHTLAIAYGNDARGQQLMNMRQVEDRFAMQRASDELYQQYFREALPLWPRIPCVPDDTFYGGLPELDSFDEDFARLQDILWEKGADYPDNRKKYLYDSLDYVRLVGRRMHLSLTEQVALHDRFVDELAPKIPAPDWWYKHVNDDRLKNWPRVLEFDKATRLLERRSRETDNQYALRSIASQIEDLQEWVTVRRSAKDPARMDEWLMISQEGGFSRGPATTQGREHFAGAGPLDAEAVKMLTRMRDWPTGEEAFVRLGEVPVWCHQHCYWVWTGPRPDPRVAGSLRLYKKPGSDLDQDPLLFLDSAPRADFDASFTVSHARPDDFRPHGYEDGKDALHVGFLFGLTDLDVRKQKDPVTDAYVLKRPMGGHQVRIEGDRVSVDAIVEVERQSYDRKRLEHREIASTRLKRGLRDGARIGVSVRGRQVRVVVDGKTVLSAKLQEETRGFAGIRGFGLGFVEVAELRISDSE